MKRAIFPALLLMMFSSVIYAQSEYVALMVKVYGSLPNGDYSEKIGNNPHLTRRAGFDIGNNVGLAQTGFGAGIELNTPVLFNGFGWIVSLRFLANTTNGTKAETEFERIMSDSANSVDLDYETGTWLNFPVMTGFRYKHQFSSDIAATAMVQGGINFSRAASRTGKVGEITAEKTTFEFARDFGYEMGLSITVYKKWNIGFSYISLGAPRFQGNRKLSEKVFPNIFSRENEIIGEKRSISMLLISVGYYIF